MHGHSAEKSKQLRHTSLPFGPYVHSIHLHSRKTRAHVLHTWSFSSSEVSFSYSCLRICLSVCTCGRRLCSRLCLAICFAVIPVSSSSRKSDSVSRGWRICLCNCLAQDGQYSTQSLPDSVISNPSSREISKKTRRL